LSSCAEPAPDEGNRGERLAGHTEQGETETFVLSPSWVANDPCATSSLMPESLRCPEDALAIDFFEHLEWEAIRENAQRSALDELRYCTPVTK
jgi:hypothetical protein